MTTADTMDVLHVAEDGEKAIEFLRRIGGFADAPRPQLIMLDLNLPRRNGLEVLEELKSDPGLMIIPVVVLTTSAAPEDVARSYTLHANAYVTKPTDYDSFADAVRQIASWFLELIELPAAPPTGPGQRA